ncbi:hypothetical protein RA28_05140 [Ruegeria sp. ANG-S4]|uniref:hypothetical protein n=1 Tax=Ruegeria sp. ANG-S4 TaxID=1577904 RepID=UPI00057DD06C|nr:hypothetical protein [Ruegeria sp. ANG-S4]KIC47086.1 hypothetical protein RA28_05140 [Ruegeria sp. ANG-S4]
MRVRLRNLLIACVFIGGSPAANAEKATPDNVQSHLKLLQRFCPAEAEFLPKHDGTLAARLAGRILPEPPELPEDQYLAFLKAYLGDEVYTVLFADMAVYEKRLKEKQPIPEDFKKRMLALLQLSECLSLTRQDRILIDQSLETAIEIGILEVPESFTADQVASDMKDSLLRQINAMECRRANEHNRRVLSIDPESSDVAQQIDIITEDTVERCEEAG